MYVEPRKASKYYGVSENAVRMWANKGQIKYTKTKGGHRRYILQDKKQQEIKQNKAKEIIYVRVSSRKQQSDLTRQTTYMSQRYPNHTTISDIGSGINFKRKGFKRILEELFKGNIKEVVVAHKDRFSRFGFSLFEWIFKQHGAKLICDKEPTSDPTSELAEDLMAIITVFSARYYGKRKYKAASLL